jgi:hypothetical protein
MPAPWRSNPRRASQHCVHELFIHGSERRRIRWFARRRAGRQSRDRC